MSLTSRIFADNRLFCLVAIGIWLLLGALFLAQAYFYNVSTGQTMDWWRQVPYRLSGYLVWGLFTVPLFHLYRLLANQFQMIKLIVIQLLLAVLLGVLHRLCGTLMEFVIRKLLFIEEANLAAFIGFRKVALVGGALDSAITYLVLMLIFAGASALIRNQQQQQHLEKVQQQLTQSRLDALQSQLQPHFLFNTLNGIVAAIHAAPMKAEAMVTQLARILRFSLDNTRRQTIPLDAEISMLEDYLKIEKARLGERLTFHIEVAEDVANLTVPPLILQPLVENAVRHGIARYHRPGTIVITARVEHKQLMLCVTDSGDAIQQNPTVNSGFSIGLSNCQARLKALYGDAATLSLAPAINGGTLAMMTIPLINQPPSSLEQDANSAGEPS